MSDQINVYIKLLLLDLEFIPESHALRIRHCIIILLF